MFVCMVPNRASARDIYQAWQIPRTGRTGGELHGNGVKYRARHLRLSGCRKGGQLRPDASIQLLLLGGKR